MPDAPSGLKIITSTPGLSAYEVALKHGFQGTEQEWLDSLVGSTGLGVGFVNRGAWLSGTTYSPNNYVFDTASGGSGTSPWLLKDTIPYLSVTHPASDTTHWLELPDPALGFITSTRHVDTQYSLTGGGDLTANRTLNLVNDVASPGNFKVYGTDGAGVRGWQSAGAGTGDVVGPAGANDNAVARFDGTTGKLIQNSAVSIADTTGKISGARFGNTGLLIEDTDASNLLTIKPGSDLTLDRIFTLTTGDAARTLTINSDTTLGGGSHSGTNTGDQTITLTSDVTGSGTSSFATTIANDAVTLAKMANMATDSILGRATAGTGDPEVLTALPFALTGGDVTSSADSNVLTIGNDTVTYAKMQNVSSTSRIIGRKTAGSGDPEEITTSDALDFIIGGTTQGVVLYRGASGWATLGPGTDGNQLTTHGASANPTWDAPGGGGGLSSVPVGKYIYVDSINGNDGTGTRGKLDKPFLTISGAIGAAGISSGDVISVGPGTFAENSGITLPSGVSLIGAGIGATNITSTLNNGAKAVITPGTNSIVSDFTVTDTTSQPGIIGCLTGDTVFTGAIIRKVKIVGGVDGLRIDRTGQTVTMTCFDCYITSNFDTVVIDNGTNCEIELWSCDIFVDGLSSNIVRGVSGLTGTFRLFNCKIETKNAQASSVHASVQTSGSTVEIHGLRIKRDTSGAVTGSFDLYNVSGTLKADDVTRDDGKPLNNSGTITKLLTFADLRGINPATTAENYGWSFIAADRLIQPNRLGISSSDRVTITNTSSTIGRITINEPASDLPEKYPISITSGKTNFNEVMFRFDRLGIAGNSRYTGVGNGRAILKNNYTSFVDLAGSATDAQVPDILTLTAISNLTTNGFVKTSGGTGALSVDTNTYLTGNQTITLSGDVGGSGTTAITTTLNNIPNATTAAGYIEFTNSAAPGSPASGKGRWWFDTTDQRFHDKSNAGTIGTTVVADTGASNNFLTAISAAGVISKAQPSFSNLSGSLAAAQFGTLTGDVTTAGGSYATTLANIPTGVTAAGFIEFTNIAAPATPASTKDRIWFDTTDQRIHEKNSAGTIGTTVVADTGASNNFLTAISAAGVISKAQPAFSNLSGTISTTQAASVINDTAFASSWNGVVDQAPSKNAVYDIIHAFDTDDDGKVNVLDMGAGIVKTDAGGVVSAATGGTDYADNAFKTISVSGQSDVVADSASDTLTLVAGTNVTITTNASTDTITFAATGGGGGTPGGSNTQVQYNNAGAFGGITNATSNGTTMTLTSPIIVTDIKDGSGATQLTLTSNASAGNNLAVSNSAATFAPSLSAVGGDTDINLLLIPQGAGKIIVDNGSGSNRDIQARTVFLNNTDIALTRSAAKTAEFNNGTTGQWAALRCGVNDAGLTNSPTGLTIGHQTSGTPAANFGIGLLFNLNDSTTPDVNVGNFLFRWTNATHGSQTSKMFLQLGTAIGLGSQFSFDSSGIANANAGYQVNSSAGTGGQELISDGIKFIVGNSAPDTVNDYNFVSVPDTGNLLQPNRLGVSVTGRHTLSGTGRVTLYDILNSIPKKTPLSPSSFILRAGEGMLNYARIAATGNSRWRLTENARVNVFDLVAGSRLVLSGRGMTA